MINTIIDSNTNNIRNMRLVFIVYLPSLVFAHIGYSTQSYCLDDIESDTLSLECPVNQLIKLGRIIYGFSWSKDCSYIDKDCTMDVPREDIICLSTTNCTVRVVEHPLILQDCWNVAASYVQAEYECIIDYSIQNICQPKDISLSNGFLSTPNYPNGFISNLNCPCILFASSGHSIVLEIIDFHLPTCAEAGLILWFGQNFQTKCLTQNPLILISNTEQNVTLRFYTLNNIKQGGFLLKYSLSPESDNATVRLHCYAAPMISRSMASNTSLPMTTSPQVQNTFHQEDRKQVLATNRNDLLKRLRPSALTTEAHKDVLSVDKRQEQNFNQLMYKKYLLPNSTPAPLLNMNLIIIFIVSIVAFLIVINVLIWFMCASRPRSSKSTSSLQNLYSHQAPLNNEMKPTRHRQFPRPSNRLKTLHSLLYADHKNGNIDPITSTVNRDSDSVLSDYHIPSNSSPTNLNHGFIIKSKSSQILEEPRQINSWDDI